MEQPQQQQSPATTKKTSDMAAYMRSYRLANLEKCRQQDREQYHINKYKKLFSKEELEANKHNLYEFMKSNVKQIKMEESKKMILDALEKYPEILNNL